MHRATIEQYDRLTREWIESSDPEAVELAASITAGSTGPVLDLGCGPGWHLDHLGGRAIGLDASAGMATTARQRTRRPILQADLERLPLASRSIAGAWAAKSYVHVPRERLPMAYRELHRVLVPGARVGIQTFLADRADVVGGRKVPGRLFSFLSEAQLDDVLEGAGFTLEEIQYLDGGARFADERVDRGVVIATRLRTLADSVGPDMRVLLCGLNPSLHAADAGFGFAGPSNRFWPAALTAGLLTAERDPTHALLVDRVGMTDLVKRATPRANEIRAAEYRSGLQRLERLCTWLQPGVLCIVGITGWRSASGDKHAELGVQPQTVGGCPVYVMPNPSGLNAHTNHDDLVRHFDTVLELTDR